MILESNKIALLGMNKQACMECKTAHAAYTHLQNLPFFSHQELHHLCVFQLGLWVHDRLRSAANQLSGTNLPSLITDLSGQYTGYTTVQPCFDGLLYQIQHINQTVIALPPNLEVHVCCVVSIQNPLNALVFSMLFLWNTQQPQGLMQPH